MRLKLWTLGVVVTVGAGLAVQLGAQAPGRGRAGAEAAAGARAQRRGNYGQNMRPLAAPDVIAHGKTLYDANCASCHAEDMMGGKNGGNLVISQTLLNDQNGELIEPIVAGARAAQGMPAETLSKDDVDAIAAYMHSVAAQVGSQGRPPGPQETPGLKVLVGNPVTGKAEFATYCGSCHSADPGGQRTVAGIGAKYTDARSLQNAWVGGEAGGGFTFGRGGGGGAGNPVTVKLDNGTTLSGKLVDENEFVVVLTTPDGVRHSFDRNPGMTVTVTDPDQAHKDLVYKLALEPNGDTVMHNVTAYLATLK